MSVSFKLFMHSATTQAVRDLFHEVVHKEVLTRTLVLLPLLSVPLLRAPPLLPFPRFCSSSNEVLLGT